MRLPARWLVALLCFLVLCISASAYAGDPLARPTSREARDHLHRGNKLYNVGSFEEAITEYKAGSLIEPAPVFDYNLGQAHRQLGRYREALWHYDRFLHRGQPAGELRDAVIAFMAEMRAHLEKQAQRMPPTVPAPEGSSFADALTTAPPNPPSSDRVRSDVPTRPIHQDDSKDWLGWSLAGSGLVALGISGALFYRASKLDDQGNSEMAMRERQDLYDQASARNLTGAIVGVGGAALATVGIVRLTLYHRAPPHSGAIHAVANRHGLFAVGSF